MYAFEDFWVERVDTQDWHKKFDSKDQGRKFINFNISAKETLGRLGYSLEEVPNYADIRGAGSGIFFVITMRFRKKSTKYTPRITKNVIEGAPFMKSPYYKAIPTILTYKDDFFPN